MPKFTVRGIIKRIFDAEVKGNFEKRKLWVEETGVQYPQFFDIEFQQGDCNKLDAFRPGQEVTVSIDMRGRYWEKDGKEYVFTTLKGWKIESVSQQPARPNQPKEEEQYFMPKGSDTATPVYTESWQPSMNGEDLPF